jgi:pimeloyl-ACP methyl ester carboxylesterase
LSTAVVYVHGLWVSGFEGAWLRRRLARDLAAATSRFPYASVHVDAAENARALVGYLAKLQAGTVHLVGHSLGGLIILKMFELFGAAAARLPPGRIVLLGSPVNGCAAARRLARLSLGRRIMGLSVQQTLLGAPPWHWGGERELGIIAGSVSLGLGRLVGAGAPGDGTIGVEETKLPGMAQHLVLPVSHTGLPFSATVARETGAFLRTGRFSGPEGR